MENKDILVDHTLIINKLKKSIENDKCGFISSFLPKGSYLVGGYIRDIILGRVNENLDIDIVVPLNAVKIGKNIADKTEAKFILLDKKREIVRVIFKNMSIDIANQISPRIEEDLKNRDFSINSIAFLFDKKCLIDPLNGLKDLKVSKLRTYSKRNLIDDPLRILRSFRFISELNFKFDQKLIKYIIEYKGKLDLVAKERINYEIQKIVKGAYAAEAITLVKKFNLFGSANLYKDCFFLNLQQINFAELTQNEKERFLPTFFISQILDEKSLEKFNFSKAEIAKNKFLRKWYFLLREKNLNTLNEFDRFKLHQELEDFLPSFIFHIPQSLRSDWLKRWRNKDDKLFHPTNLINGDVIKKTLKINEGPLLGQLLQYLSRELAYQRLNNFDEAIYEAKQWIEQNAPKCD